jgi:uncharacterized protein (DUF2345 family)
MAVDTVRAQLRSSYDAANALSTASKTAGAASLDEGQAALKDFTDATHHTQRGAAVGSAGARSSATNTAGAARVTLGTDPRNPTQTPIAIADTFHWPAASASTSDGIVRHKRGNQK